MELKADYKIALDMLKVLNDGKQNIMLSPMSIDIALNMESHGLKDKYSKEMDGFYGIPLSMRDTHYLATEQNEQVLKIANSLWLRDNIVSRVSDKFRRALENIYDADVAEFDNSSAPIINKWVLDKTNGMIPEIIDDIDSDLKVLLINALYFKGKWVEPFRNCDVSKKPFKRADGTEETCDMMKGNSEVYMETDEATAFTYPYENGYRFVGILPKQGIQNMTDINIKRLLESKTYDYDVTIGIPKFKFEYSESLNSVLTDIGLGFLFKGGAINGMLSKTLFGRDLSISSIVHKTAIEVSQEGTEAAAVTAVFGDEDTGDFKCDFREVILDRPFIFMIMDGQGNTIFLGIVNNING